MLWTYSKNFFFVEHTYLFGFVGIYPLNSVYRRKKMFLLQRSGECSFSIAAGGSHNNWNKTNIAKTNSFFMCHFPQLGCLIGDNLLSTHCLLRNYNYNSIDYKLRRIYWLYADKINIVEFTDCTVVYSILENYHCNRSFCII